MLAKAGNYLILIVTISSLGMHVCVSGQWYYSETLCVHFSHPFLKREYI